jgi:hypothetical protein
MGPVGEDEDVALVRRALEAFAAGEPVDERFNTPEVDGYVDPRLFVGTVLLGGRSTVEHVDGLTERAAARGESFSVRILDLRSAGPGRVFAELVMQLAPASGGAPAECCGVLYTLRDGRLAAFRATADIAGMRAELGLGPRAAAPPGPAAYGA